MECVFSKVTGIQPAAFPIMHFIAETILWNFHGFSGRLFWWTALFECFWTSYGVCLSRLILVFLKCNVCVKYEPSMKLTTPEVKENRSMTSFLKVLSNQIREIQRTACKNNYSFELKFSGMTRHNKISWLWKFEVVSISRADVTDQNVKNCSGLSNTQK